MKHGFLCFPRTCQRRFACLSSGLQLVEIAELSHICNAIISETEVFASLFLFIFLFHPLLPKRYLAAVVSSDKIGIFLR